MLFNELDLPQFILTALEKIGISNMTEIQEKAIPQILNKKDIVGKSMTGSGKTFAYGIPVLTEVEYSFPFTQALIVCPTRELVTQVTDELRKLNEFREGCRVVPIFGGSNMDRQIQQLKKSAKVVVGTPGRLCDHLRRNTLKLKNLKTLVLDEADEMLDMGFREDLEFIINQTNPYRQTVMFSATMPKEVLKLAKTYMKDPEYLEINKSDENKAIYQQFIYVGEKDKNDAIKELIETLNPENALIFCNTKKMVEKLTKFLTDENFSVIGLHGDMRQNERKKAIEGIKKNKVQFLVATDVAGRGLDISGLDMVINFDIPDNVDYYTHRIGRTGRAGKTGKAITLINNKYQLSMLSEIEEETNNTIEEYTCRLTKKRPSKAVVIPKSKNEKYSKAEDKKEDKKGKQAKKQKTRYLKSNFEDKNFSMGEEKRENSKKDKKAKNFGDKKQDKKDFKESKPTSKKKFDKESKKSFKKEVDFDSSIKSNDKKPKDTNKKFDKPFKKSTKSSFKKEFSGDGEYRKKKVKDLDGENDYRKKKVKDFTKKDGNFSKDKKRSQSKSFDAKPKYSSRNKSKEI